MSDIDDFANLGLGDDVPDAPSLDDIFGDGNAFDTVKIDELPDDPFGLPANTYRWSIDSVELAPTKNNSEKYNITVISKIVSGPYADRQVYEWLHYPRVDKNGKALDGSSEVDLTRSFANLNLHLKAYGLSDDQIAKFNHRNYKELLMGNEYYATTYNQKDAKSGRTNVKLKDFRSLDQGSGQADNDDDNPFARSGL
jgi:hypothetical protein